MLWRDETESWDRGRALTWTAALDSWRRNRDLAIDSAILGTGHVSHAPVKLPIASKFEYHIT